VITAAMGSHPFNYLLELFAATLAFFPATASGLVIPPAIPLLFFLGFWWYRRMFDQICRFVAEQAPQRRPPMNPGGLIALALLTPGAIQLLLRATGFPLDAFIWVSEALFPVGLAVAFCLLLSFRNSIAQLLAHDAEFPKLTQGSPKEIGIMPSADRLETSS
jgi:hypothetical protein